MEPNEDAEALKRAGLRGAQIEEILAGTQEERIRGLRALRCQMLGEIHGRQQALDRLDYVIHRLQEAHGAKKEL